MKRILEGVIPIGTPWGGPESRTYLSAFVSMLMHVERREGTEKELQAAHERLYHLYLAVSGIGASTVWSEGLAPCSHEQVVDRFFDDHVERTMAYAGYQYGLVEGEAIRANRDACRRRIQASIDRGVPVLACSPAAEWSIVTGYDNDGEVLIGWDGANGYWGPPAIQPDGYLEDGRFATASWPDAVSRLVFVEGKTTPRASSKDVLAHVASVMQEQRSRGYDREFKALLQDDDYCRSADDASLRTLWGYVDGYVGWYAENRCFIGSAFHEGFPLMPDVRENDPAVESLHIAGGFLMHTHDTCWEGWRALRATHPCNLPEEEPCRMCGGCLRPATDEDYAAFREPERRRSIMHYLKTIDWNDAKTLAQVKRCVSLL